ncbi:MAG: putative N-acetylglucosamine kinase [Bacteroidetes bacterium HLUCCA01]|nr:MAG: putative N-acetylglucosamine kinase [Bacteroidetes bacterium HLUCCA01]
MEVWLGIDASGSRSVLLAVDSAMNIIHKEQGGALHARMMKLDDQVSGTLLLIENFASRHKNAEIKGLCIGIAGGGREVEQNLLRTELEKFYPDFPILVTSDAHVAHAEAFKNGDGILIITGTGSIVLGRKNKRWDRAGGYGFLIGDPAGGYRMGQESLYAICTAMDGGRSTAMEDIIRERFSIGSREDLILKIYDNTIAPAEVAPLLLEAAEQGDDIARHIITDNCTKLASQVALASETLQYTVTPVCVIGSLFENTYFRDILTSCLVDALGDIKWIHNINEPAMGACRLIISNAKSVAVQ